MFVKSARFYFSTYIASSVMPIIQISVLKVDYVVSATITYFLDCR